jgi:D-specific alpha-keto acid dehydrogenase
MTVYSGAPDEARLFEELAPQLGVEVSVTRDRLDETTIAAAAGSRCVSVAHRSPVTGPTLKALRSAGVCYVSTRSTGHDHIDTEAAAALGITVEGVGYSPDSVADFTLMLMLMAVRDARSTVLRTHAQDFRLGGGRGRELRDLTVGVVGVGRIGTAVIRRLHAFGCRVLAYDRRPKADAEFVGLAELLERSDLVTLHTPLTRETHHLLNAERLRNMKAGAYLVNTARGALIDTSALVDALETGRLAGAALDVVEGEDEIFYRDHGGIPVSDDTFLRLQRLPNVLITPHMAYYTEHALADVVRNTILNALEFEGHRHA